MDYTVKKYVFKWVCIIHAFVIYFYRMEDVTAFVSIHDGINPMLIFEKLILKLFDFVENMFLIGLYAGHLPL